MITRRQLRLYRFIGGDTDMMFRALGPADIEALTKNDAWRLIKQLVYAAHRLERERAPAAVQAELEAYIQHHTADEATRRLLRTLGRAYPRIRLPWPLEVVQTARDFTLLGVVILGWVLYKAWPLTLLLLLGLVYWVATT